MAEMVRNVAAVETPVKRYRRRGIKELRIRQRVWGGAVSKKCQNDLGVRRLSASGARAVARVPSPLSVSEQSERPPAVGRPHAIAVKPHGLSSALWPSRARSLLWRANTSGLDIGLYFL